LHPAAAWQQTDGGKQDRSVQTVSAGDRTYPRAGACRACHRLPRLGAVGPPGARAPDNCMSRGHRNGRRVFCRRRSARYSAAALPRRSDRSGRHSGRVRERRAQNNRAGVDRCRSRCQWRRPSRRRWSTRTGAIAEHQASCRSCGNLKTLAHEKSSGRRPPSSQASPGIARHPVVLSLRR